MGKLNLVPIALWHLVLGFYFLFSGNNPITEILDIIKSIYEDKIKHYYYKIKKKSIN
jgi:S-ribosylhomocysteine lyase LuxS involved in autoinducer biosynthesis